MPNENKGNGIKIGVVGYGSAFGMGRQHLSEAQRAGMTPTAVCDIDRAARKTAASQFPGIEIYSSIDDMLDRSGIDLVAVITPHNTHAELTIQCLTAGRHVVCEKPMAVTTRECTAMIKAAQKNNVSLSVYHNRHWDGGILHAGDTIKKGLLGEVVRIDGYMTGYCRPADWWRSSKTACGGILYDCGVHLLEYCLQLIDAEVTEVAGYAFDGFWAPKVRYKADTTEDECLAVVRFADRRFVTLHISVIDSKPAPYGLTITGTKGAYVFDVQKYEIVTHKGTRTFTETGPNPPNAGYRFYQNVADHLLKGAKLIVTPEWARRPVHILELAHQSARQGKALKAQYS